MSFTLGHTDVPQSPGQYLDFCYMYMRFLTGKLTDSDFVNHRIH